MRTNNKVSEIGKYSQNLKCMVSSPMEKEKVPHAEMMGCGLGVNLQTSGYLKTQADKTGLSGVSRSM